MNTVPISFTPPLSVIPVPVVTFGVTGNTITVSWSALTGVDGYKVYRRTDQNPDLVAVSNQTTLTYSETLPVSANAGDIFYIVRAYQGPSESANSNVAVVRVSTYDLENLPTSDPHVAGQRWNNGGVMCLSAG